MNMKVLLAAALCTLVLGCSKDAAPTDPNAETGPPEIVSLTAEKLQILYGGQDPAIITCEARGGNLTYKWAVDLGDIIPLNASRSKVSFNGSACCVGEKTITCTVSNSQGSVSKSIIITILEAVNVPEIIALQTDKSTLNSSTGETASLVCYAIGGQLKYAWEADCGVVSINPADSSRATYTATPACAGTRTLTCRVSNGMGSDTKTLQLTIGK